MRDPTRIKRILNKLETAWLKYPDFRLGQLYSVVSHPICTIDPFFVEDDSFEQVLDKWLKDHNLESGWKS